MKKGLRGFTLIELLVVIAIIGLLSTVIAGPVQTGLKKGRDAKRVGNMKQIQSALAQFSADNQGLYPANITVLVPSYLAASTDWVATTLSRDKIMYVTYADVAGNIISYHLGVPLENQNVVLQSDADCINIGTTVGFCANTGGTAIANSNWLVTSAGAGNGPASSGSTDFNGAGTAEAAGGLCTNVLTSCIYDLVPQ